MISATTLRVMMDVGLKGERLMRVVDAVEADMAIGLHARSKNAERQQRFRDKKAEQSNVTNNVTRNVTEERNDSNATPSLSPTPPNPSPKENPPTGVKRKGSQRSEAFGRFKTSYPARLGSQSWEPAWQKFDQAVRNGVDPETIIAAAARYAEEQRKIGKIGTEFVMKASTWMNQKSWQDYPPPEPSVTRQMGVFIAYDSPEWRAWREHLGKPLSTIVFEGVSGWWFESQWPPEKNAGAPEFLLRPQESRASAA